MPPLGLAPALTELLGEAAKGFSPASIVRFKQLWEQAYQAWGKRDLSGTDHVYVWADGVRFPIRLEADQLTCLVLVGVLLGSASLFQILSNGEDRVAVMLR